MSKNNPNVVGEGSYGCIHRPSLKCSDKKINYHNKVSKVFTKKNALDEYKNFEKIDKIDKKEKFHSMPTAICEIKNETNNINAIKKCNNYSIYSKVPDKLHDLLLLVIDDNGIDLEKYVSSFIGQPINETNSNKVKSFFVEMYTIIKGIQLFLDNDIVHHDLKPSNLMYDSNNDKIRFIDFGLMDTLSDKIKLSKKSDNWAGTFHWSYPLEASMYNTKYFNSSNEKKILDYLSKYFYQGLKVENIPIEIKDECSKRINHIKIFLSFINYNNVHLNKYFTFMKEEIISGKIKYNTFLETSYQTFDIYGLGITFLYILDNLSKFINKEEVIIWEQLFSRMVEPDINKRIKINDLLNEYKDKLFAFNYFVLTKKDPIDYIIDAKKGSLPTDIIDKNIKIKHNKVDEIIHTNTIFFTPKCTESNCKQIHNLSRNKIDEIVNRVVKEVIKESKLKNKNVKTRKLKSIECKAGKELNPKTRRCVKVCNPGYIRNENFKCIKGQSDFVETKTDIRTALEKVAKQYNLKLCPEGKELNPKTNRCVKKCIPRYQRNVDFKCVKTKNTVTENDTVIIHSTLDNMIIDKAVNILQHSKEKNSFQNMGIHKTRKNTNNTGVQKQDKKCPEGKELNPKTNRCINKCKPGEIRNNNNRCVKEPKGK
jgi:serine/threonine protein kinase